MSHIASPSSDERILHLLEQLQKIRKLSIDPAQFWQEYLDSMVEISGACVGIIALSDAQTVTGWQSVALSPKTHEAQSYSKIIKEKLIDAGVACSAVNFTVLQQHNSWILALELNVGTDKHRCMALFRFDNVSKSEIDRIAALLQTVNDIPSNFQLQKFAANTTLQQDHGAKVLDLVAQMNQHKSFLPSAMAFCNELASHFNCDRVSLGWYKKGYIQIQALSHTDSFNKKMEVVKTLELAMEEVYDQDTEIVLPAPARSTIITRDHESYARAQDCAFLCSVPLRNDNEIFAVCTLERAMGTFSETDLRLIGTACDQVSRRLYDLKKNDQWIGALFMDRLRERAAKCIGYEHTWAKVIAISLFLVLAFCCFVPITYRLDSPVILRTDEIAYLTVPFDGHIESVGVRVGDEVKGSTELMRLDQSDLLLQESALSAETNRYLRESEKARATDALADMLIAEAMRDQSSSRLAIVRYKLSQAIIRAPFNGIIVEGDLKEKIGSPVKQGDPLFKIARIDHYYAKLDVRESEIHNVSLSMSGEIALASRPQDKFKIKVTRIEPAAVSKKDGNVFIVHAALLEATPSWWRPGMTGLSKLNAGKKTILWIATHRTVDFLRMKLWW